MSTTVLVTGAFGNIGSLVVQTLLARGCHVVAFDKAGPVTRKNARAFAHSGIQTVWGDITVPSDIAQALHGVDAVIHLAGIFPPLSENRPDLAQAVNVGGTRHLVDTMIAARTCRRLVFASSIAVYGKQQGQFTPPLNAATPLTPDDHYGHQKAECERLIRDSDLDWTLMRIAACPPVNIRHMASFKDAPVFDSHPDSRLEVIHPADAALAFAKAVACDASIGKTLLLGGGVHNRLTTLQLFNAMLASIGLKPLPREAFNRQEPILFHGDWVDTTESQQLLQFQHRGVTDIHEDFWRSLGLARFALPLLKPFGGLISRILTRRSPYYRAFLQQQKNGTKHA